VTDACLNLSAKLVSYDIFYVKFCYMACSENALPELLLVGKSLHPIFLRYS